MWKRNINKIRDTEILGNNIVILPYLCVTVFSAE